jgi:hypothetical protein
VKKTRLWLFWKNLYLMIPDQPEIKAKTGQLEKEITL